MHPEQAVHPELTIVVPVYNEYERVEKAIRQILAAELPVQSRELIVVDDGSTDGTAEVLAGLSLPESVRLLAHPVNRGKGAAIRTALGHARGRWTTIMDADLEYTPHDLAKLLGPLIDETEEVVFGTRVFESHSAYNFWYVLGNRFVTFVASFLFNCWISDVMTCLKAMSTARFRSLDLRERGFAVEAEIAARVLRSGVRIYEVPIKYQARDRHEGKKLVARDGVRVLRTLLRCRIR